jgi:hypothetical protein
MKIILRDGHLYQPHVYRGEPELQGYVEKNFESIFGSDSIWLPGGRIGGKRTDRGAKGIPDGFVVQILRRNWAIVEIELASHPLHDHITPQIGRFSVAWKRDRKRLVDRLFRKCEDSKAIMEKFRSHEVTDVYKFLADLIENKPDLVIVIDEYTDELEELKDIWKFDIHWSIFRTYMDLESGSSSPIFEADALYQPTDKTLQSIVSVTRGPTRKLVFLGKSVPFRYSKEIPSIVSSYLVEIGKLTPGNVPWGPGKNRYLVNTVPKHPKGNDFFQPVQLRNGWWVETHASEEYQLRLASQLLEHCGETDTKVRIEPL